MQGAWLPAAFEKTDRQMLAALITPNLKGQQPQKNVSECSGCFDRQISDAVTTQVGLFSQTPAILPSAGCPLTLTIPGKSWMGPAHPYLRHEP
jgi:hypothetical protein